MIHLDGVAAAPGGRPVLSAVSLDVERGETVAVLGPNGAGKTTLLKLVAGLRDADEGTVDVDGVVGFAPEDPRTGLFAETVAEEVAFFPRNRGLDVERRRDEAMAALAVDDLGEREPHSLSVGEQRRVSIASVLAGAPDALVLDEPTRGLDAAGERHLVDRLDDLDATVLFSTHLADAAWAIADRVAVLADGGLQRTGAARSVLRDEAFLEAVGVRPPAVVQWASRHGIDPPPADLAEALERLEASP